MLPFGTLGCGEMCEVVVLEHGPVHTHAAAECGAAEARTSMRHREYVTRSGAVNRAGVESGFAPRRPAMRRTDMAVRERGAGNDKRCARQQRRGKNKFVVWVHGFTS
jgi:hypothetical protein